MTFKEQLDALKGRIQAKITSESSQEQIDEITGIANELDSLELSYNEAVQEQAKLKDTIVRMVQTQGSGKKPIDESQGSKPMTIDECIAEISKGGK